METRTLPVTNLCRAQIALINIGRFGGAQSFLQVTHGAFEHTCTCVWVCGYICACVGESIENSVNAYKVQMPGRGRFENEQRKCTMNLFRRTEFFQLSAVALFKFIICLPNSHFQFYLNFYIYLFFVFNFLIFSFASGVFYFAFLIIISLFFCFCKLLLPLLFNFPMALTFEPSAVECCTQPSQYIAAVERQVAKNLFISLFIFCEFFFFLPQSTFRCRVAL